MFFDSTNLQGPSYETHGSIINQSFLPYIKSLENLFKRANSAECSLQGSLGSEETEVGRVGWDASKFTSWPE